MTAAGDNARRFDRLAGVATLLAILACYGTTLALAAMSMLGMAMTFHEGAWAGVIAVLAILAVAGVASGYRRHNAAVPVTLATGGGALILWAMFGDYHWFTELAGFVALAAAALWDWRLKKQHNSKEGIHAGNSA